MRTAKKLFMDRSKEPMLFQNVVETFYQNLVDGLCYSDTELTRGICKKVALFTAPWMQLNEVYISSEGQRSDDRIVVFVRLPYLSENCALFVFSETEMHVENELFPEWADVMEDKASMKEFVEKALCYVEHYMAEDA